MSVARDISDLTVVILNDFCYVQGGASKVAIDEAISLARAGAKVLFVGAVGPPCAELLAAPLQVISLEQRELLDVGKHPWVAIQGLWNFDASRRIGKILRSLPREQTIVHLHGYTKALTVSPVREARRLGFSVVCTLHDFFAVCPNGAFFDYQAGAPCTRRALSISCITANCDKRHYAHKLFRVGRGMIQRAYGEFPAALEHYVALSNRSAALLAPYLSPGAQLHPLENAIDWERPQQIAAADNRVITYVGRLDQEKGVLLLADAAAALGLKVTFVGDGPLRGELESRADMTVTGWIPREEVRSYLHKARCVVFPSLWYETYGLVVAEAAAHGIPAIVSDITAAAERVENGVTGWLFRSGDRSDLMRCLRLVSNDDDQVRSVGDEVYRSFWAQATTPDIHVRDLTGLYKAILDESAARAMN